MVSTEPRSGRWRRDGAVGTRLPPGVISLRAAAPAPAAMPPLSGHRNDLPLPAAVAANPTSSLSLIAATARIQPAATASRRPGGMSMSASQPETDPNDTLDPKGSLAQFPLVLRGYDRHLVDTRLAELAEELSNGNEPTRLSKPYSSCSRTSGSADSCRHGFPASGPRYARSVNRPPGPPTSCWPRPAPMPRRPSTGPRPRRPAGEGQQRNKLKPWSSAPRRP